MFHTYPNPSHRACILRWLAASRPRFRRARCPVCRAPLPAPGALRLNVLLHQLVAQSGRAANEAEAEEDDEEEKDEEVEEENDEVVEVGSVEEEEEGEAGPTAAVHAVAAPPAPQAAVAGSRVSEL